MESYVCCWAMVGWKRTPARRSPAATTTSRLPAAPLPPFPVFPVTPAAPAPTPAAVPAADAVDGRVDAAAGDARR